MRQDQIVRVYLPATLDLVRLWRTGGVIPRAATAYGVTAEVMSAVEGDSEEEEFAVTVLAADESLVLLASDPAAPTRRVVVVSEALAVPGEGAEVALEADIAFDDVAAVLVDDAAVVEQVSAAISQAAPELLDDVELLWFAADELDDLLK